LNVGDRKTNKRWEFFCLKNKTKKKQGTLKEPRKQVMWEDDGH
jgi:hypothetical protein